jgi:hypothetical protein
VPYAGIRSVSAADSTGRWTRFLLAATRNNLGDVAGPSALNQFSIIFLRN